MEQNAGLRILVTGAAGFIGSFVSRKLCRSGHHVLGIDNLNDYYDVSLKEARLAFLREVSGFQFLKLHIADHAALFRVMSDFRPHRVIHLAAQAGVRYSSTNPFAYSESNLTGTLAVLEGCRQWGVEHLVYASTSSVYGLNQKLPFSPHDSVDHPASLYAATKRSCELMAHSYSHMFGLPTTGLRFFTVYGPFGRPDMALFIFTKAILKGEPIEVFNNGQHVRDFTYVEDIAEGVCAVGLGQVPRASEGLGELTDPSRSSAPFRIYNIGNSKPVSLERYIQVLEENLQRKAVRINKPLQPGDVVATQADVKDLEQDFSFRPATPVEVGVKRFVEWYRNYYGLSS